MNLAPASLQRSGTIFLSQEWRDFNLLLQFKLSNAGLQLCRYS